MFDDATQAVLAHMFNATQLHLRTCSMNFQMKLGQVAKRSESELNSWKRKPARGFLQPFSMQTTIELRDDINKTTGVIYHPVTLFHPLLVGAPFHSPFMMIVNLVGNSMSFLDFFTVGGADVGFLKQAHTCCMTPSWQNEIRIIFKKVIFSWFSWYCWWLKSCTSW